MIDISQAMKILKKKLPDEYTIVRDETIEKDYGWVFFIQSKDYLITKKAGDLIFGNGGYLIEKATGKLYKLPSCYSYEINLLIYELGYFKYEEWDLEIIKVTDKRKAINIIYELDLSYTLEEKISGIIWKTPRDYDRKIIQSKLNDLPTRFNLGNIYSQWESIYKLERQEAFQYKLVESYDIEK